MINYAASARFPIRAGAYADTAPALIRRRRAADCVIGPGRNVGGDDTAVVIKGVTESDGLRAASDNTLVVCVALLRGTFRYPSITSLPANPVQWAWLRECFRPIRVVCSSIPNSTLLLALASVTWVKTIRFGTANHLGAHSHSY